MTPSACWNAPESKIEWIEGHYQQYLAYKPEPYEGAVTIFRARALPLLSPHRARSRLGPTFDRRGPRAPHSRQSQQPPAGAMGAAARRAPAGRSGRRVRECAAG